MGTGNSRRTSSRHWTFSDHSWAQYCIISSFSWPLYDASCFEWCWWCEDNTFHWYVLFPSHTNTPRDDNLGSYINMATRLCLCYVEAYGHWYRWLVWLRRSDVENGKIRLGAGLTTFPSWFDTNIRRGISSERLGELIPHRLDVSSISILRF